MTELDEIRNVLINYEEGKCANPLNDICNICFGRDIKRDEVEEFESELRSLIYEDFYITLDRLTEVKKKFRG